MLLDKGMSGKKMILKTSLVEAMTCDQLTTVQKLGADLFFAGHSSWGFGMTVNTHHNKPWNVPGRFGWDGGFGTSAYSDPKNEFIGILLTQKLVDSPEPTAVSTDFWSHAYESIRRANQQ